jgi:hypothetical protein
MGRNPHLIEGKPVKETRYAALNSSKNFIVASFQRP